MKIRNIICAALLPVLLAGCYEELENEPAVPSAALQKEIQAERKLRLEAETRAEKEAGGRSRWEMAAFALGIAALAAFVGGTAIGSRGKRHARS